MYCTSSRYPFIIVSAVKCKGSSRNVARVARRGSRFGSLAVASPLDSHVLFQLARTRARAARARARAGDGRKVAPVRPARTDYRGNSIEVEAFPAAGAIKIRENASSRVGPREQEEYRARARAMFSRAEKLGTGAETWDGGGRAVRFATAASSLVGRSWLGMPPFARVVNRIAVATRSGGSLACARTR